MDEVLPHEPMRQWVLSFPYQLRFLFASRPELMGKVLGIVHRAIASHLIKKAGLSKKKAQTGAVTLIQRFGSALNLNVHFHMLFLDGVYTNNKQGKTRFQRTMAPNQQELTILVHTISHRVARFLERQGVLERDEENSYLQLEGTDEDPMPLLIGGCSASYRNRRRTTAGMQGVHVTDVASGGLKRMIDMARLRKRRGSACMPGWQHKPGSVSNWKGYVATFQDLPYRKNAFR